MDMEYVYLDLWDNSLVLEKDNIAPPERYIKITKCKVGYDITLEHWIVKKDGDKYYLDYSYPNELGDEERKIARKSFFEYNDCTPIRLVGMSIPNFEEYVKEYYG